MTQTARLVAFLCAVCGREWTTPLSRAGHERSHGGSGLSPEALRERQAETDRRWKERNPRGNAEASRRYHAKHPHHARDFFRANPDKAREYRRRSYARDLALGRTAEYQRKDVASGASAARRAVRNALKSGRLIRDICRVCGESRVEAHHFLGYAIEHRLDVRWLCKRHHEDAHHLGLEVS